LGPPLKIEVFNEENKKVNFYGEGVSEEVNTPKSLISNRPPKQHIEVGDLNDKSKRP